MPDFDEMRAALVSAPEGVRTNWCSSCWRMSVWHGASWKLLWPGVDGCVQRMYQGTPLDAIQAIDNREKS